MIKNYVELVQLIENGLGWTWPAGVVPYRARAIEAGKIKKLIASMPSSQRPSLRDLELTVEWLRQQRASVNSPVYVVYAVEEALKVAVEPEVVQPLTERVDRAIQRESDLQREGWQDWVIQLRRAIGPYREDALEAWAAAGRAA